MKDYIFGVDIGGTTYDKGKTIWCLFVNKYWIYIIHPIRKDVLLNVITRFYTVRGRYNEKNFKDSS